MPIPKLTHRQFLAITYVIAGNSRGRDLRDALKREGVRQSGPAFYQLMATLEDAGYVTGWYEQQVIRGQIIRERHYQTTAGGRQAWKRSVSFYRRAARPDLPGFAYGP